MTKIRIKLGTLEVEYEGEAEFLTTGLYELIERVQELSAKKVSNAVPSVPSHLLSEGLQPISAGPIQMTAKTMAAKLNASSGPDLALAAMCSLHHGKGMATYKRSEVLN